MNKIVGQKDIKLNKKVIQRNLSVIDAIDKAFKKIISKITLLLNRGCLLCILIIQYEKGGKEMWMI